MPDETQPPQHVEDTKTNIDQTELIDMADHQAGADDPIVQELTETQRVDDGKDSKENDGTSKEDKSQTETSKQKTTETREADKNQSQQTNETETQTETERLKDLETQLQFYQQLFGPKEAIQQPQPTLQPQPTITPQPNGGTAQTNILDAVQITENELTDLLSGAPERAGPVIKKFIATAMYLTTHNFMQTQAMNARVAAYNDSCVNAFYEQFEDLKNYRPLVKIAGDELQAEMQARGIQKYPHETIKEIGTRARKLRDQLLASSGNSPKPTPKPTIRQGEVSGTRPTLPKSNNRTEQQKQMDDLLVND